MGIEREQQIKKMDRERERESVYVKGVVERNNKKNLRKLIILNKRDDRMDKLM